MCRHANVTYALRVCHRSCRDYATVGIGAALRDSRAHAFDDLLREIYPWSSSSSVCFVGFRRARDARILGHRAKASAALNAANALEAWMIGIAYSVCIGSEQPRFLRSEHALRGVLAGSVLNGDMHAQAMAGNLIAVFGQLIELALLQAAQICWEAYGENTQRSIHRGRLVLDR